MIASLFPEKTFRCTEKGPQGLVGNKKVLVASSCGGAYAETPLAFLAHQKSSLKVALGFFSITDSTFARVENASRAELREQSTQAARARIAAL